MNWLLLEKQKFSSKVSSLVFKLKFAAAPGTEMRGKPLSGTKLTCRDICLRSRSIDYANLGSSFVNVLQIVTNVLL